jgi:histidinol-phosphate phosphatase family protein
LPPPAAAISPEIANVIRKQRAVFLDRDGVINSLIYHREAGVIDSPFTEDQFKVLPRVPEAIRAINDLGFLAILVSNQPGIAKRHFTAETLRAFDRKLLARVERAGGRIDAIYYCLHHPQAKLARLRKKCVCRKPGTGMLKAAAKRFHLKLKDCYMVGDGFNDMAAGRRAGCKTVFIGAWKCEHCRHLAAFPRNHPDFVAKDLWSAAQLISRQTRNHGTSVVKRNGTRPERAR